MARINTPQLIDHATSFAARVDRVQQDPAVRKAWIGAGADAATALHSVRAAARETGAAWRRTAPVVQIGDGDRDAAAAPGAYAA